MGYNVANYRIFVFCVSAFMAAAAGALYAAWVGLVSFLDTGPVFSIEAVIWTAVGGRGTIIGPVIGTFLVEQVLQESDQRARDRQTEWRPDGDPPVAREV